MIYLDNAASTMVSPTVKQTMIEIVDIYGNPSSIHSVGELAKEKIDESSEIISNKFHCDKDELYYTTGATMSNNIAIQGFLRANPNGVIILSKIEHNDIIMLGRWLTSKGYAVRWIDVDVDGYVNLSQLDYLLNLHSKYDHPILVSIQMANGEIGTIQNMNKISKLVHKYSNAYLHTDATQYIPYFNMDTSLVDMFSMSGQKIHCIKGTGLLYIKKGTPITPIIFGEQGLIGGTENVVGICCLATAVNELHYKNEHILSLRNYFITHAKGELLGSYNDRLPNNVCLLEREINGAQFVYMLDECGICISSGSACSNLSDEPSHVIKSLGFSDDNAENCIRISVGDTNTMDEIKYAVDKINTFVEMLT